ncbi:MAG TPA: hypothetical protein VM537_02925 [Anaerolineae bacterium]|nr:hypothetical protein [Anaerolineae bacterium]
MSDPTRPVQLSLDVTPATCIFCKFFRMYGDLLVCYAPHGPPALLETEKNCRHWAPIEETLPLAQQEPPA